MTTRTDIQPQRVVARLAHWARVQPKNSVQLGSGDRLAATLSAVVRAVILTVPKAQNHYLAILDQIEGSPIGQWLRRLPAGGKGVELLKARGEEVAEAYGQAVLPCAEEFSAKWLFGSGTGAAMVAAMSIYDVRGVDLQDVERQRTLRDTWQTFYVKRGKARERLRDQARTLDGKQVNEDRLMREASMWASAHHVHPHLVDAVVAYYGEGYSETSADQPIYKNWSERLAKFDQVLGRERRPGTWNDGRDVRPASG